MGLKNSTKPGGGLDSKPCLLVLYIYYTKGWPCIKRLAVFLDVLILGQVLRDTMIDSRKRTWQAGILPHVPIGHTSSKTVLRNFIARV